MVSRDGSLEALYGTYFAWSLHRLFYWYWWDYDIFYCFTALFSSSVCLQDVWLLTQVPPSLVEQWLLFCSAGKTYPLLPTSSSSLRSPVLWWLSTGTCSCSMDIEKALRYSWKAYNLLYYGKDSTYWSVDARCLESFQPLHLSYCPMFVEVVADSKANAGIANVCRKDFTSAMTPHWQNLESRGVNFASCGGESLYSVWNNGGSVSVLWFVTRDRPIQLDMAYQWYFILLGYICIGFYSKTGEKPPAGNQVLSYIFYLLHL